MFNYLLIVVSMLIWSTWGLMIRWLGLPPVVVLFYNALVASIAVPVVLRIRGELDLSGVGSAWHLFAASSAALIVNNLSYFYALGHTTVANAVFTHYTAPVFVALLAPVLIAERLQRVTLISLPIAVAGMALVVMAGGGLRLTGEHAAGIAAGTVSGIAYALLIIYSRKLSQLMMHHKAVIVLIWVSALVTAPAAWATDHTLTPRLMGLLVLTGIAHSTVAPLLYYSALRKVMAQHAAILGYIEPLAAVPLAFFFLAESPSPAALLGGILILLSGYLIVHEVANNGRAGHGESAEE
jgi:drug/metabolite transporter (DMT)-like permease